MAFAPPKFPRAMFIACLAVAGALTIKLPQPKLQAATATRVERRDRAVRHYVRGLGRAIVAAGRAARGFEQSGRAFMAPKPKLDPRIVAVIDDAGVRAAIGPVSIDRRASACIELSPEPPRVSLMWRGNYMPGDGVNEGAREIGRERFIAAVRAAEAALERAGHRPSGLTEIRWLQIGKADGAAPGKAFTGFVASIPLRRLLRGPMVGLPSRAQGARP